MLPGILMALTNYFTILLIWLFVSRFKRVTVQVVQDEFENTFNIFKKLNYFAAYQTGFMAAVFIFTISLIVYIIKSQD